MDEMGSDQVRRYNESDMEACACVSKIRFICEECSSGCEDHTEGFEIISDYCDKLCEALDGIGLAFIQEERLLQSYHPC